MKGSLSTSQAAREGTEVTRAVFDGFVAAVLPLIRDQLAHGRRDHGAIADAFNARGLPCWGRARWLATDIRMVLSHGDTKADGGPR